MDSKYLDITWPQFEVCNPNTQIAFENMCRQLFNNFFFDGKALFHSDPNNPGVEILPILHKETGKYISFQAKYFSSIDYSQIMGSAQMTMAINSSSRSTYFQRNVLPPIKTAI